VEQASKPHRRSTPKIRTTTFFILSSVVHQRGFAKKCAKF
jgi:hypothetical protein